MKQATNKKGANLPKGVKNKGGQKKVHSTASRQLQILELILKELRKLNEHLDKNDSHLSGNKSLFSQQSNIINEFDTTTSFGSTDNVSEEPSDESNNSDELEYFE